MVWDFIDVYNRRGLKINVDMSKMMVLNVEEILECEVSMNRARLEQVSEFKYLGCALDESSIDVAECRRKVTSGRKVACVIRSLVNFG